MRRLMIIGADVTLRAAPQPRDRHRVCALARGRERAPLLRAHGVVPIAGDLDHPASLDGVAGIKHHVLHCTPPPHATRTAHGITVLAKKSLPQRLVDISTSGVCVDCGVKLPVETRRVDAERRLRVAGRHRHARVCVPRTGAKR